MWASFVCLRANKRQVWPSAVANVWRQMCWFRFRIHFKAESESLTNYEREINGSFINWDKKKYEWVFFFFFNLSRCIKNFLLTMLILRNLLDIQVEFSSRYWLFVSWVLKEYWGWGYTYWNHLPIDGM